LTHKEKLFFVPNSFKQKTRKKTLKEIYFNFYYFQVLNYYKSTAVTDCIKRQIHEKSIYLFLSIFDPVDQLV
jgi:hypothetical protein